MSTISEKAVCLGRESQLKLLEERFQHVQSSDYCRRVMLIYGAEGVGKTHLMSAFRLRVLQEGGWVFEGHCGGDSREPFAPFAEIQAAIHAYVPDVGNQWRVDAYGSKSNFFESVRSQLQRVSRKRPCVIYLHDLEAIDEDSLELLVHLLQDWGAQTDPLAQYRSERFQGLLVASVRHPHELGSNVRKRLEAISSVEAVHLTGFDRQGLAAFLNDGTLLEKVFALTKGNPLKLQRLIHTLPDDVVDFTSHRRRGLSQQKHDLLQLLAVAARPLALAELARILDTPAQALAPVVAGLAREQFLVQQLASGEALFELGPLAPRDAIFSEMGPERLAFWHAACLSVAEARLSAQGDSLPLLEQILRHALGADDGERAAAAGMKMATLLESSFSYERAIATLLRVEGTTTNSVLHTETLRLLARLYRQVANFTAAKAAAEQLLMVADSAQTRIESLTFLGELHHHLGEFAAGLSCYEQALAIANTGSPEQLVLVKLELAEFFFVRGDFEQAEALASSSVELLSGRLEYARQACDARNILGKIYFQSGRYDDAERMFATVCDTAGPLGLDKEKARALHNLALTEIKRGNPRDGVRLIEESREICERNHEFEGLSYCMLNLGVGYQCCNEFASALDAYRGCIELFERLGQKHPLARALSNLGDLYLVLGCYGDAREAFNRSEGLAQAHRLTFISALNKRWLGKLLVDTGRAEEAVPLLEQSLERLKGHDLALCHQYLAEACVATGDVDRATREIASLRALDLEGQPQTYGFACLIEGDIEALRGEVSAAEDTYRRAIPHFQSADHSEGMLLTFGRLAVVSCSKPAQAAELFGEMGRRLEQTLQRIPQQFRDAFTDKPEIKGLLAQYRDFCEARGDQPESPEPAALAPPTAENVAWRGKYRKILGHSAALLKVLRFADKVARSDSTVLVLGESGTGKELLAEAICAQSRRASKPFVRVNTAALAETLLHSELFGHEKGAFTGATARKVGKFELASGGTIFLDEIGDISQKTQVSLLRVLQEQEFQRVGGTRPVKVDVRVILATNRDLESMVREGRFRLDLYYRINGLTLTLPALRERREDIPLLSRRFMEELIHDNGRRVTLGDEALEALADYDWPGNIRELRNVLSSVYFFSESEVITAADLEAFGGIQIERASVASAATTLANGAGEVIAIPSGFDLATAKREMEIRYICEALQQQKGNITHAAAMLQMKRSRLSQKVKEYDIDANLYKKGHQQ